MQKTILLFGAGKSATVLIDYLIDEAKKNNWKILIADTNKEQILLKINDSSFAEAFGIDVKNGEQRSALINQADIVISLMPPDLHFLIAKDCVAFGKNLLTASYIDEQIKSLLPEIEKKGLLFICEMGLDPGIDHMSAMKIIDSIKSKGAKITSFKSHCGGLIAPESDDNPWHYKISWNPRNIVMAGKAGALYKLNGTVVNESYNELFNAERWDVSIPGSSMFSYYPNRDSLHYIDLYGLQEASTFIRTTLRHPDFMFGWRNMVNFKLTDETDILETNGLSLKDFFKQHLEKHGFGGIIQKTIELREDAIKLLKHLQAGVNMQQEAIKKGKPLPDSFTYVTPEGSLEYLDIKSYTDTAVDTLMAELYELDLILEQLYYLGVGDSETLINKGKCSPADVLQFVLENKLALKPSDKDMIVMLHEINFEKENSAYFLQSSMIVKGENNSKTAMAKTVGLPLGIVAKLILNNSIKLNGLHIPVKKEIYEPVLAELGNYGIRFNEVITLLK